MKITDDEHIHRVIKEAYDPKRREYLQLCSCGMIRCFSEFKAIRVPIITGSLTWKGIEWEENNDN